MKIKMLRMLAMTAAAFAAMHANDYSIDKAHSEVGFSIKHLMITNVKGTFGVYDGNISLDPKSMKFEKFSGVVDIESIDTGIQKRDDHLRSEDFFDAANHPKMTFVMKKYEGDASGGKMTGDLTIRGTTKEVALDTEMGGIAKFMDATKLGFTLTGKINRKDFGLNWNKALETGGVVVDETVKIIIEIEAKEE